MLVTTLMLAGPSKLQLQLVADLRGLLLTPLNTLPCALQEGKVCQVCRAQRAHRAKRAQMAHKAPLADLAPKVRTTVGKPSRTQQADPGAGGRSKPTGR